MRLSFNTQRINRLERLCDPASADGRAAGCLAIGKGGDGIERLEAFFYGEAFSPHRHDDYAIGVTLSGVQSFRYRGKKWNSLPNQCCVIHPDEKHDGFSGTAAGFGYCIVYIDPSLIQQAIGGHPLPFVSDPVLNLSASQLHQISRAWDMEDEIDDLGRIEIAISVSKMLTFVTSGAGEDNRTLPLEQLERVRDMIAAAPAQRYTLDELERIAGLDRWTLARQFRAAFGTSPTRFRSMRQLDLVRALIKNGSSLSEAALEAGFADQSHMSRKFKESVGLSPARWAAAIS